MPRQSQFCGIWDLIAIRLVKAAPTMVSLRSLYSTTISLTLHKVCFPFALPSVVLNVAIISPATSSPATNSLVFLSCFNLRQFRKLWLTLSRAMV
jgi:hypothetical protein